LIGRGDNYENQIHSGLIRSTGPGSLAQRKVRSTKRRFSRTVRVYRFPRGEAVASITISRRLHPRRSGEGRLLSLGDRKESCVFLTGRAHRPYVVASSVSSSNQSYRHVQHKNRHKRRERGCTRPEAIARRGVG